ncbi:IPT/TIG domain-containing protein, partial [bacterium]|nr:IPT/TIG domain-containing protein [bacterium]
EKPESKLWWNDGLWWGSLWDPDANVYRIHRFNLQSQCWVSVGPEIDDRSQSRGDALWDGEKLYIVSHAGSDGGRMYRYSYDSGTNTYSADSGFPVSVNDTDSEALVMTKDSSGQLWVTWTDGGAVMINRSLGNDQSWGDPFVLPVAGAQASSDDVSSVVSLGGNKIGVLWSNQSDERIYFAVHEDDKTDLDWNSTEIALEDGQLGAVADDHVNLAVSGSGASAKVVAVTKSSLSGNGMPQIYLLVRDSNGSWSDYVVAEDQDGHTRPIVVSEANSDKVHVFLRSKKNGGSRIYRKTTSLSNPQFQPGLGEFFIDSSDDSEVNDPTSTKQPMSAASGLLVLASDDGTLNYLHNYMELEDQQSGSTPIVAAFNPASGIVGDNVTITGQNFSGTTVVEFAGESSDFTFISDTELQAVVPVGATTGKIRVTTNEGVGESPLDFTLIHPPVISSFSPPDGQIGTEVLIAGSNLSTVTSVTFNGVASNAISLDSDSELRATIPLGASTGRIVVRNAAGSDESGSDFTVTHVPAILSFSPTAGIEGTDVAIDGVDFTGTTEVSFGNQTASFTFISDTELISTVPFGATTGKIRVTNGDGTGESSSDFVVIPPPVVWS